MQGFMGANGRQAGWASFKKLSQRVSRDAQKITELPLNTTGREVH